MSAEAVFWVMEHVENISTEKKAVSIMEQMLSRNLIRHCSGDASRQTFMYGFYLYYILDKENSSPYQGNMYAFRCDWIEVRPDLRGSSQFSFIFSSGWVGVVQTGER